MNIFKESTQFKNWLFKNNQELDKAQVSKFERGLKILAELNRDLHAQEHLNRESRDAKMNIQGQTQPVQHSKVSVNLKKIIQPMEEKEYIIYYTNQIKDIIMRKSPSRSLKTYALTFFRRFYLRKTAIDYDPDYLLCAALFLGFKVSQMSVNIDTMKIICPFLKEKHPEKNVDNILLLLEYEFYLINILNYDLYVFCPYKAMVGFLYTLNNNQKHFDIKIFSDTSEDYLINAKEFENKVESFIDQIYLTDLIFLYTYSYIALSCIFLASEFYQINFDIIKSLLQLESIMNYNTFLNDILPTVKDSIKKIKILSDEEFINNKKKILKFLSKNPKYVERIERDREELKKRMSKFSDMFDDNLVNSQTGMGNKMIIDDKFIDHKRERENIKQSNKK